jgi:hypothetical protein
MPLKKIPYKNLEILIKENLIREEHEGTRLLIAELKPVKKRGYLLKAELVKISKWKSPRAIHLIKNNSEKSVNRLTQEAFSARSEKNKLELLTKLKGVSVPMASSILMLLNPKRYGVIDIRVWQVLYKIGTMTSNSKGINFKFNDWHGYLIIIRHFANKFNVTSRDIERTLFKVHQTYQQGNLYEDLIRNPML